MDGTLIDRLKNIQNELMGIAHQAAREGVDDWPLIAVMTATELALDRYIKMEGKK